MAGEIEVINKLIRKDQQPNGPALPVVTTEQVEGYQGLSERQIKQLRTQEAPCWCFFQNDYFFGNTLDELFNELSIQTQGDVIENARVYINNNVQLLGDCFFDAGTIINGNGYTINMSENAILRCNEADNISITGSCIIGIGRRCIISRLQLIDGGECRFFDSTVLELVSDDSIINPIIIRIYGDSEITNKNYVDNPIITVKDYTYTLKN